MATVTWTGGANDGNLSTGTNWSTGSVPAVGDDVVIDSTSLDIMLGLTVANAWNTCRVTEGYKGNIGGGAAGSLNVSINSGATQALYIAMGGGAIYLGTGTRPTSYIQSTGRGQLFITGGTNTTIELGQNTKCDIGGTPAITTISAVGGSLTIGSGVTGLTTLETGGTCVCSCSVTNAVSVPGGALILDTACATTTAKAFGLITYRTSGTQTLTTIYPTGKVNFVGATKATTLTATKIWVGGILDKSSALGVKPVFTAQETYIGAGN
jgi:hypothetical protein